MKLKTYLINQLKIMKAVENKNSHQICGQLILEHGTIHDRMKIGDYIKSPGKWNKQLTPRTRGWLNYQ
jgi:hypothetical protein